MNYFDYSSEGYGYIEEPLLKYQFFLHIEATHVGGCLEIEFLFYYRIKDKKLLEIAVKSMTDNSLLGQPNIAGIFELKEPFDRSLLKGYIREYITNGRNYLGLDYVFHSSTIMSENQFEYLMEDVKADLKINKHLINQKWSDSPIVKLCEEYDFAVFPTPEYDYIAECRCPTGYSHRIQINLKNDTWGCGYCRVNGGVKELIQHFRKYVKR
jgi:hypothetical protein